MVQVKGRGERWRKEREEEPLSKLSPQNAAEVCLGGQVPTLAESSAHVAYYTLSLSAHSQVQDPR